MTKSEVDWSKYLEQYDIMCDHNKSYLELERVVSESISSLRLKNDSVVIDLGGGTGRLALAYAIKNPNHNIILNDNNQNSLDRAAEKAKKEKIKNITIIPGDMETVKLPEADVINMMHALYVTGGKGSNKPIRILRNTYNSLKPGGYFLFTDIEKILVFKKWAAFMFFSNLRNIGFKNTIKLFNENSEVKKANKLIEQKQRNDEYLIQTLDQCITMIKNVGFEVIKYNNDFYRPGFFGKPIDYQVLSKKA